MSDPIATALLADVSYWWPFDGSADDVHGSENVDLWEAGPTYEAGSAGQRLAAGCAGRAVFASPIVFGPATAQITMAWRIDYSANHASDFIGGLAGNTGSGNLPGSLGAAMIAITNTGAGALQAFGFATADPTGYSVGFTGNRKTPWPFTVQIQDSMGQLATSDQIIAIDHGASPTAECWLFLTWDNGLFKMYTDSFLQGQTAVSATYNTAITQFQVGEYQAAVSICPMDNVFVMRTHVMTQAEITWFVQNIRTYDDLVALA